MCGFEPRQKLNYFQFRKNYVICATICLEYKFRKYQNKILENHINLFVHGGVICKIHSYLKQNTPLSIYSSLSLFLIYEFKSFSTTVRWLTDMRLFQRKRKCCKLLRSFSVMKFRICSREMLSATKWETN